MDVHLKQEIKSYIGDALMSEDFHNLLTTKFIKPAIQEITQLYESKIQDQAKLIDQLTDKIKDYEHKFTEINNVLDSQEQYSRRNCLVIHGTPEQSNEKLDTNVIMLGKKMDVNITPQDIDRVHRLGPRSQKDRPIIVKFTTYKARATFLNNRSSLRKLTTPVYINENLTKNRAYIFKKCRDAVKSKGAMRCWTHDGNVMLMTNDNRIIHVKNLCDIPVCNPELPNHSKDVSDTGNMIPNLN